MVICMGQDAEFAVSNRQNARAASAQLATVVSYSS